MSSHMIRRSGALVAALVCAALIAAGCGGSKVPPSNPSLGFVPETSIGYLMADSNVSGAGWTQVNKLASSVDGWKQLRGKITKQVNRGSFTYADDVKPWIGKHVGVALMNVSGKMSDGASEPVVLMVESKHDKQALASLKSRDSKQAGRLEGADVYRDSATNMYWVVSDHVVLLAKQQSWLRQALQAHSSGNNITKDDGANAAAKRIDDKAVAWVVIGTRGYAQFMKRVKKSYGKDVASAASGTRLNNAFNGAAIDVVPASNGFRMHAISLFNSDKLKGKRVGGTQFAPQMMKDVPADAYVAYTNMNLGKLAVKVLKTAQKNDSKISRAVTGAEVLSGVSLSDLSSAYRGEFTVFAGPGKSLSLMITNMGATTAKTTQSLIGIARLASGSAPVDLKLATGDFSSTTIRGMKIVAGSTDKVSLITTDANVAARLGAGPSLADSPRFKQVVAASGMPSKVDGFMYLDPTAAMKALSSVSAQARARTRELGSTKALGPAVVWITSGSDSQSIEMFMQVKQ